MPMTIDPHQADIDRVAGVRNTILDLLRDPENHPIKADELEARSLQAHAGTLVSCLDHRMAILSLLAMGQIDFLPDDTIILLKESAA